MGNVTAIPAFYFSPMGDVRFWDATHEYAYWPTKSHPWVNGGLGMPPMGIFAVTLA